MLLDSHVQYFKRYCGYSFWVALEVVIIVGVPKLVIFPLAAYFIGKEQFGIFLVALGIAMIVGVAPSNGLATGIIRNFTKLENSAKDILISTSVRLCKIAMSVVILVGLIGLAVAKYLDQVEPRVVYCIIPLLFFLYSWNLFQLQMVRYRVERRFAYRTIWYAILAVLLLIAIPLAILGGAVGMAWGYSLGYFFAYIILSFKQRILFKKSVYDSKYSGLLKKIWFHSTVASMLGTSSRYIYRIILSVSHSFSSVSVLFGATNIMDLCMAPLSVLSSLLLSMLGGFVYFSDVGKKQRCVVLFAGLLITICATFGVLCFGPLLLSLMFPEFAEESAQILRSIIMIIPCAVAINFSRPFVVKFGRIEILPFLNFVNLIAHLLPALIFIPKLGIQGAVISYNIGYGVNAITWLGVLIWTLKTCDKYNKAAIEAY